MKNIVVVGGGGRLQDLIRNNKYRDSKILAVFDNDKQKQGMRLGGVPVLPVEEIASYSYDEAVVTPRDCKWRLTKQLLNLKVDCDKIKFYHTSDDLDEYFSVNSNGEIMSQINKVNLAVCHASDEMIIREVLLDNGYQFHISEGGGIKNQVIIDIGMNVGISSLYFAQQKSVSKIYGFEPFADPFESALKNFNLNEELSKKIIPMHYGLSNENKRMEVPFNKDWITASRIFFSELPQNVIEEIEVKDAGEELERIRQLEGKDKTYILKIDCEGSEYQVIDSLELGGALDYIDVILGETHDSREKELFEYLERHSFSYFYRAISPTQCIFKAIRMKG